MRWQDVIQKQIGIPLNRDENDSISFFDKGKWYWIDRAHADDFVFYVDFDVSFHVRGNLKHIIFMFKGLLGK